MKNIIRRRSITMRMATWTFIVLITLELLTFGIFRIVSGSILQKTVRGYLLSSVNENLDKIKYHDVSPSADLKDSDNIIIRSGNGWLEIDDDFLDEINDVQSSLYSADGTMLYGKNPIARSMEGEAFNSTRIYKYRSSPESNWYIYDRKLKGEGLEDLWIRGIVTLSSEEMQLKDIFNTAVFFVPFLLIVGIAGVWITAKRSLSPVRRIEQTISEITQGKDLNRRLETENIDAELYDMAAAFNNMLDRLEHSFEAEQQFTSDASHELRTPMAVIMAQTELSLEKPRTPEQYRQALEVIHRQGKQMNLLIGSMLDYTRLELRPENYPLSELDFSVFLKNLCDDMTLIGYKNNSLSSDIEGGIRIMANEMLIERAVRNLIDNAYKYGKENGCIRVSLHRTADNKAQCLIADNGPGIPPEDLPHIFERFYRGSACKSGRIPGSGLGLAMVRMIVDIHHGEITATSSVEENSSGTIFSLNLPIL